MKPKLSDALPYCLAMAHALLATGVFVLIQVSHDRQRWLFFVIVALVDYPASIAITYLSEIPTVSGNVRGLITFGTFLLLGSAWWFLLGWVLSKLVSAREQAKGLQG